MLKEDDTITRLFILVLSHWTLSHFQKITTDLLHYDSVSDFICGKLKYSYALISRLYWLLRELLHLKGKNPDFTLKHINHHTRYSFCVTRRVELHGIRVLWASNNKRFKVITATLCLAVHICIVYHSLFITAFPLPTGSWHLPSIDTQPTDGVAPQVWTSLFMEWCSCNKSVTVMQVQIKVPTQKHEMVPTEGFKTWLQPAEKASNWDGISRERNIQDKCYIVMLCIQTEVSHSFQWACHMNARIIPSINHDHFFHNHLGSSFITILW